MHRLPPGGVDPSTRRLTELIATLQSAETELQNLVGDQVDAVVLSPGEALLLRDAQRRLREQEAEHRQLAATQLAIISAIPAHIALLDADGYVRAVNAPWRAFGIANGSTDADAGLGMNYLEVCAAASGECAAEARAAAEGVRMVLRGESDSFTMEYGCHAPHAKRWFRLSVNPFESEQLRGAVVMHVDVTERKLTELALAQAAAANLQTADALQAERERLVAAQHVARIGSWETDLRTLDVQWSDETFRIFGLSPGSGPCSHERFLALVHPDDRAEVDAAFRASFATRGLSVCEHRLLLPDGTVTHVEERWHVVTDADGTPTRAIGTCQDITERKHLEAKFLRAQRLESVGTLAGGIAHDLNNVLAPIQSAVELLALDETDPERLESLTTIARSAARGADLIRQVLGFARGVEGKRVPVQLAQIVREVHALMRETFPKTLQLVLDLPADVWLVLGDPTQLHQVLLNLCVNARDATPDNGTIRIEVANVVLTETVVEHGVTAIPGEYVRLAVIDTGVGIPVAMQDRLFEPFFTTKELGRGTGLGLSTALSIVRSHGGFIRVTSRPGDGALFELHFPASRGPAVEEEPALVRDLPRGNGETVLVVDDEEAIRTVVERMLVRFGYRVLTAGNGAEALARFSVAAGTIDCVLTDMTMPVMGGADTIVALRALNPRVPIIASSGQDGDERALAALGTGHVPFIAKPYTADVLLAAIARAVRSRRPPASS